jgi:hypothetical protein
MVVSSWSLYVSSELVDASNIRLIINSLDTPILKDLEQTLDREQEVDRQWNTYNVVERASETISFSLD